MKLYDRYSEANITVNNDQYEARNATIEGFRGNLVEGHIIELAEYLFGLREVPTENWLPDSIRKHDPSFSVHSNAREIRLLSAQILENEVAAGSSLAGLVVLTGKVAGLRKCAETGSMPDRMEAELSKHSSNMRNMEVESLTNPESQGEDTKLSDLIETTKAANSFANIHLSLDSIYKNSLAPHPSLLKHVDAITILSKKMDFMREESNLLWWHISEWSTLSGGLHTKLPHELAAVLLPFDAANIVLEAPSPVSLPALLQRALATRATKLKAKNSFTISEVIESLDVETLEKLPLPTEKLVSQGLFPLIYALKLAKEFGTGGIWAKPFKENTGLDPNASISVYAVALQISRELDALKLVK